MSKQTGTDCATISVNDSDNVRSTERHMSVEGAVSLQDLVDSEVAPKDLKYFYTVSLFAKSWAFIKTLKIEVITFLYMFSYVMRSVTSMTMILHKVCHVDIGFDPEVCANLEHKMYAAQKLQVERMANNFHLGHTLMQIIPSALLASNIGPWSDKYGRKPPIISALIGIILDGIGAVFCAYFMETSAGIYIIPAIFTGLSGGFIGVFTVVYSYASDITPPEGRTFKYTLMEMALGIGAPIGTAVGGYVFKYLGFVPVFLTSLLGHFCGLLWVIFVLDETKGKDNKDRWEVKLRNFFSWSRTVESYRACVKPRPHKGRTQLWLMLLSTSLVIVALMGGANISYLFTYHHYSWTNTQYSTVSAVFSVMGLVAMFITVPLLTRVFKLGDPTIGMVGNLSAILKNVGTAIAAKPGVYIFANLLGLLSGLSSLAARTRISKIVSKNDIGKVFAFMATVESTIPIVLSVIVTQVFNHTVGIFPDPSYLGFAVAAAVSFSIFVWMAFLPKVNYEEMQEGEEEETEVKKEVVEEYELT